MAATLPHGRSHDVDFMFTKLVVHDLERATEFYRDVFGLVEVHRLDAEITGRKVSEVVFMPTSEGGPMFVLVRFHDRAGPASDETILGFATQDLDALLERANALGGVTASQTAGGGFRHAFLLDPEGHLIQISQPAG
ncbi:hypothetical protein NT2_01_05090 [Caenibius tardaugens NBRC 16725]|uniref:VOC domain-containing protein n=1 Tax=Caenibius tardaugens NBRC 16725 TaxID=1219035 RepID=U2YHS3_9SPHN|nr:VOC family protein [Caenibius tardaugens]GAD47735.1 hypothetical protein NT2_01_05090 [Caenibius tardaugens NBRC 16725]